MAPPVKNHDDSSPEETHETASGAYHQIVVELPGDMFAGVAVNVTSGPNPAIFPGVFSIPPRAIVEVLSKGVPKMGMFPGFSVVVFGEDEEENLITASELTRRRKNKTIAIIINFFLGDSIEYSN